VCVCVCVFVYITELWADSLDLPYSAHTVKAGRLCAACVFRDWFYAPEQNGSFYFLCNFLALTFRTTTCKNYILCSFCECLVTTCCLYRLPSCSETNQNLFQDLMFVPCIIRRSWNNQHNAQICTAALFYILAPTCFGSSLQSSGSFWIHLSYVKIQIDMVVNLKHITGISV
jgi:hypothetical protein